MGLGTKTKGALHGLSSQTVKKEMKEKEERKKEKRKRKKKLGKFIE